MKFTPLRSAAGWAFACLLGMSATTPAQAVDKGVYAGEWVSQEPAITLKINDHSASFTVNGKTYTDNTPEYFYGQLATYPFLYLQANEPASDPRHVQNEHRLYLIIGEEDSGNGQTRLGLRGYYDFSQVGKDEHGTVDSESIPIQMEQAKAAPAPQVPPVKKP